MPESLLEPHGQNLRVSQLSVYLGLEEPTGLHRHGTLQKNQEVVFTGLFMYVFFLPFYNYQEKYVMLC